VEGSPIVLGELIMAKADYYLCDSCNEKTFSDACLDYGFSKDGWIYLNY